MQLRQHADHPGDAETTQRQVTDGRLHPPRSPSRRSPRSRTTASAGSAAPRPWRHRRAARDSRRCPRGRRRTGSTTPPAARPAGSPGQTGVGRQRGDLEEEGQDEERHAGVAEQVDVVLGADQAGQHAVHESGDDQRERCHQPEPARPGAHGRHERRPPLTSQDPRHGESRIMLRSYPRHPLGTSRHPAGGPGSPQEARSTTSRRGAVMPCSTAQRTACVRLVTPIERYAVRMCDFTVFIDSSSLREISLLGTPAAIRAMTSVSRGVSPTSMVERRSWRVRRLLDRDQPLAQVHLLQRCDQLRGRERLREVAVCAGEHRPLDEARSGLPGVDHDPGPARGPGHLRRAHDSAAPRERVDQREIGLRRPEVAVGQHHHPVGVLGHHGRHPHMDELTFVDKRHAQRLVELHGGLVPPFGAGYAFRRRASAGSTGGGAAAHPASSAARGSDRVDSAR